MNPLGKKDKTQIFVQGVEMHKVATFMCNYSVKSTWRHMEGLRSRLRGEKWMRRKCQAEPVGVNDERVWRWRWGGVFSTDELSCLDSLMWASDPQQQRG